MGVALYLAKHVKKSECWSREKCCSCDFRTSHPNSPTVEHPTTTTTINETPKLNNESNI